MMNNENNKVRGWNEIQSELFTPEVELELFIQENILNVGVLELKSFAEKNKEI